MTQDLTPNSVLLDVADVRMEFGGIVALSGASFQVGRGEICGLIGPNGAGKTTLFNCVSRLYQPTEGRITLDGVDLLSLRADQIADAGVARTFQNLGLFESLRVWENVAVGAYHRTSGGLLRSALGLTSVRKEERRQEERARAELDALGLGDIADAPTAGLPFGTLKRIELARALMGDPKLLMLDEPANGLIHEEVMELAGLVKRISSERSVTVLLVEHHMAMVMSISDHVVALDGGRVIARGTPSEVRSNEKVLAAYLGAAS